MPKQVRLRRGTTAQHATFTGADGEITFDVSKKVLVVHDGVTPGGKPIDGFVKLSPGNPYVVQTLESTLEITGGDAYNPGLIVTQPARFDSLLNAPAGILSRRIQWQQETLDYAPTVNLDFNGPARRLLTLTGDLAFTATNLDTGKSLALRLTADDTDRTLTFPADWKFVSGAAPATLAATKTALLLLDAFGPTDPDLVARYLVEP